MIHARQDYNRFQDPLNKIGQDEPVMIFRAQDKHFKKVLRYYSDLLSESGNYEVACLVEEHIQLAEHWELSNDTKEPDL